MPFLEVVLGYSKATSSAWTCASVHYDTSGILTHDLVYHFCFSRQRATYCATKAHDILWFMKCMSGQPHLIPSGILINEVAISAKLPSDKEMIRPELSREEPG